ncbi:MAG: serine hydrolase family protein [Bacteroidales bacterium]|nr:serine hydrolase family protein [Bacteroidales bacterium]
METNYLIIPGYGNSESEHWQTYFEEKLPNCIRIQQKSWDSPICNDWVENINKTIRQYKPETVILVAHSLGGIAIAHWALRYKTKIKGAMIVAPPDVENPWQDFGFESFTPIPILKLPFPSILVASTNDNWATVEKIQTFAENWGSKLIFIGNAGHINSSSGYGIWDEGLNILKNEF